MKTQTHNEHLQTHSLVYKTRSLVVLALALSVHTGQTMASGAASGSYDENVLFNPSEAVLLAEAKGRVTIYDGLEHSVVDHALDTQFGRIGSMMFIRTRETLPDGEVEVDDDCDSAESGLRRNFTHSKRPATTGRVWRVGRSVLSQNTLHRDKRPKLEGGVLCRGDCLASGTTETSSGACSVAGQYVLAAEAVTISEEKSAGSRLRVRQTQEE